MYRILSLDGGGVRGIVPALVLADLERRAERPVAELFDLVAATSTGAIVALGLLRPGVNGKPARTAREIANYYEDTSSKVFDATLAHRLVSGGGLLGPKYLVRPLELALEREFGDATLAGALRPVLITSYDLKTREPFFFKTSHVRAGVQNDQLLRVVARATSAAPGYFHPAEVVDGDQRRFLVDGGLVANNPTLCAYAEAVREVGDSDEIGVVSIGTGAIAFDYASPSILEGGTIAWAGPLFDIVLDGQEDAVHYQMRQILAEDRYCRLQADLPECVGGKRTRVNRIDDASKTNLRELKQAALDLVRRSAERLERIATEYQPREHAS